MQTKRPSKHTLADIQELLACPKCRKSLELKAECLRCQACGNEYPVRDGIAELAVLNEAKSKPGQRGRSRESYQQEYQKLEAAEGYNLKYEQEFFKRMSTRRELHLLNRLLSSQPRSSTLLELPCGGGRLTGAIIKFTDLLIEADIALGQVQYGLEHSQADAPQIWMTASALQIPFRDAALDGVVCIRLCHHLPRPEERRQLVAELLRVARRFVVLTFFDYHSLKNILRRAGQPIHRKRPKFTMTVQEVREVAREHGARLAACPVLSWVGSGHRYALLVKS